MFLEVYFQGKFLEVVLQGHKVDTHIVLLDIANLCPGSFCTYPLAIYECACFISLHMIDEK